mmetsp:Transcript_3684/g.4212  ORF Transcript_3684/g.4212 Transcript_3684/m.4212 type:complete len:514 (+) Transcript_3684:64-1605(+)
MKFQGKKNRSSGVSVRSSAVLLIGCLLLWINFIDEDPQLYTLGDLEFDKFGEKEGDDDDGKTTTTSLIFQKAPPPRNSNFHNNTLVGRRRRPPVSRNSYYRQQGKRGVYDHPLGKAVEKAKYHSFKNRDSNSGHNYSDWDALVTSKCDHQGEPDFLSLEEIQRLKLPQAILIGVQKGGTTALFSYLDSHPDVEATEKELYFMDEELDRYLMNASSYSSESLAIPRKLGREIYVKKTLFGYDHHRPKIGPSIKIPKALSREARTKNIVEQLIQKRDEKIEKGNFKKMTLDMTPNYMIHSDRVPVRIQCLVPWVKLFVLLRNPVERARSQYDMKRGEKKSPINYWGEEVPTFDEFLRYDIDALYETGVFQDWDKVNFDDFWDSELCWSAWQKYIHCGLNAPVGMGLYALQLKPFLDMISNVHSPSKAKEMFFAIDSKDLQTNTDETFHRLLNFLGLKPMSLTQYKPVNQARPSAKKKDGHTVSEETLEMLQKAIEPYNQKLADLLGDEWKDKWSE